MDRPLKLNFDIFLLILSLADDSQTKLALMSTCQVLYEKGGKLFLKTADVHILTERELTSFLQFLNADGSSRMRHLRSLTLGLENPSGPAVQELENMFIRLDPVSQLTRLDIFDPEALLSAHPPLSEAISKLTSLRSIMLCRAGELSFELLKSMRSTLASADIDFDPEQIHALNNELDWDITYLPRQFSSSLRELHVAWGCNMQGGPQYSSMRSLTLGNPHSHITWHFVRAFPNLEHLSIAEGPGINDENGAGISEFRAMNVSLLRLHGSWQSLDTFEGPVSMLWILGLQCPIRILKVSIQRYDDFVPEMLRDVLSSSSPAELELIFYNPTVFHDPAFAAAFIASCPPELKKLLMTLELKWAPDNRLQVEWNPDLDLGAILDAITNTLHSFSTLEEVSLCIHIDFYKLEA